MENRERHLDELIELIQFIETVGVKIRGLPDAQKILDITTKEFAASQKYDVLIFFLSSDGSTLNAVATSLAPTLAKADARQLGFDLREFHVALKDTRILRRVVKKKQTAQISAEQLTRDMLPPEPAALLLSAIGYTYEPIILTPIFVADRVYGVLVTVSTHLGEYLMPSVKNLAQHISNALERSFEYQKLRGMAERAGRAGSGGDMEQGGGKDQRILRRRGLGARPDLGMALSR
jgi:GAF domain-containing protein